jgi:hypothetical protein
MLKKLSAIFIAIIMCVCLIPNISVHAEEEEKILDLSTYKNDDSITQVVVGNEKYVKLRDGKIISIDSLPSFDSYEEANNYRNSLVTSIMDSESLDSQKILINDNHSQLLSTHSTVTVASANFSFNCWVSLKVSYTTSGDHNTGVITHHNAYTTLSGYTLAVGWEQTSAHSEITSSGKDIYAEGSGELITYILIKGLIEIGRQTVNLHGYCYPIK